MKLGVSMKVWGAKTMKAGKSALDRINEKLLVLNIKKAIETLLT